MRVSFYLFLHVFGSFILNPSIVHAYDDGNNSLNCSNSQHAAFAIGAVVEKSSRIGREQKIAMEMAIRYFCRMASTCSCPTLHLKDSQRNSIQSVYEDIDVYLPVQKEREAPSILAEKERTRTYKEAPTRGVEVEQQLFVFLKPRLRLHVKFGALKFGGSRPLPSPNTQLGRPWSVEANFTEFGDRGTYGPLISSKYINFLSGHLSENFSKFAGDIEIAADRDKDARKFDAVMKQFSYWPVGRILHSGKALESKHKPLKVGVPAEAIFNQFVKVSYDQDKNKTYVTGTSIDVLEAVVKELSYSLSYVMVPYKGTYDSLVVEVNNQNFDMAIGDIEITADRYKHSQFSQPYMDTELVMVAPVKRDSVKEGFIFIYAFTTKTWLILLAMTVGTVSVVWFNEHIHGNEDFDASSTLEYITRMLWFAIAVLSLSHRELIKNNLSRLVLATWFCVNMIVAVCFTATLSSILTDSRFQPSLDIHRNNYVVGCNENSVVCRYLVDVLHFSPKNIRHIQSIEEYSEALNKGEIEAAVFVSPHANVFLSKYCQSYEKTGPTIKLGGFGFVFPMGSTLVWDISEAILKVAQTGEIDMLEKKMLRSLSNCSQLAHESKGLRRLDPRAFTGLFILSGCISAFVFFTTLSHLIAKRQVSIWSLIQSNLITRRVGRWLILLLRTRVVHDNPGVELTPTQAAA